MKPVNNQAVDRELVKAVIMKLAGLKNNIFSTVAGCSVAMTEEVKSFEENGVHYDIFKILMHRAIDSRKVHTAKQVAQHVYNFGSGAAGGALTPTGLGELGSGIGDLAGWDQDTSGLARHYQEGMYRALKSDDKWLAASQCAHIYKRIVAKFAVRQNMSETKMVFFLNVNATSNATLENWYQQVIAGKDLSMTPYIYDIRSKRFAEAAGGALPNWVK